MMIGNIIDDKKYRTESDTRNTISLPPIFLQMFSFHDAGNRTPDEAGRCYITSGILDVKEEVVKEAVVAAGLEVS